MADTTPKANESAAADRKPNAENPLEEVRYERAYLIEMGQALLRTAPMYVDGALAQLPDRKTFTLAEAEELVKQLYSSKLEPDAGAPA